MASLVDADACCASHVKDSVLDTVPRVQLLVDADAFCSCDTKYGMLGVVPRMPLLLDFNVS